MSFETKIKVMKQLTHHYFLIVKDKSFEVYYTIGLKSQIKVLQKRTDKPILKAEVHHDLPNNRITLMLFYSGRRIDIFILSFDSNNYMMNLKFVKQVFVKPQIDEGRLIDIDFNYMFRCVIMGLFRIMVTFNYPNEDSRNHSVYYINLAPEETSDSISPLQNSKIVPFEVHTSEQQSIKICGLKNCIAVFEDKYNEIKLIRYNLHKDVNINEDSDRKNIDTYILDFKSQRHFESINLNGLAYDEKFFEKYDEVLKKCKEEDDEWFYKTTVEDIVSSTTNEDTVFFIIEKGANASLIVCSIEPKGILEYVPGMQFNYVGGHNNNLQISLISESLPNITTEGEITKKSFSRDYILSYGSEYGQFIKLISYKVLYQNEYLERHNEDQDYHGSKSSSLGASIGFKFTENKKNFVAANDPVIRRAKHNDEKNSSMISSDKIIKEHREKPREISIIPEESRENHTNTNISNTELMGDQQTPIGFEQQAKMKKLMADSETATKTQKLIFGKKTGPANESLAIYANIADTDSVKNMIAEDMNVVERVVHQKYIDDQDRYARPTHNPYRSNTLPNQQVGNNNYDMGPNNFVRKKKTPQPFYHTKINLSENFEKSINKIKQGKHYDKTSSMNILHELDLPEVKIDNAKLTLQGTSIAVKNIIRENKTTLDSMMFSRHSDSVILTKSESQKFVLLGYGEASLPGKALRKLNIVRESDIEKHLEEMMYEKSDKDIAKEAEKDHFLYPFVYVGEEGLSPILHDKYYIINEFSFIINSRLRIDLLNCDEYIRNTRENYNFKKNKDKDKEKDQKSKKRHDAKIKTNIRENQMEELNLSSIAEELNSSSFTIKKSFSKSNASMGHFKKRKFGDF